MCGIRGLIGDINSDHLNDNYKFLNKFSYRGPDAYNSWVSENKKVLLSHLRLSIIDVGSVSDQPFLSDDQSYVVVFNGEIYNYIELREELIKLGYVFKSNGDTEVLLKSYIEWGYNCLSKFNGMFSFAIFDSSNKEDEKLFIARDRVGEKPFYYKKTDNFFEFSSELKGISNQESIDIYSINYFLSYGYIPGSRCITKNVNKLPPAHAGVYSLNSKQLNIWKYWQLPKFAEDYKYSSLEELSSEVWKLLIDSVKLRLRSDVPIGVFLSGGLDSSLITAAAASNSQNKIKTFSATIKGSLIDESKYSKIISDHFNTEHYTLDLNESGLDDLNILGEYIDEPIADSSIIPTFLISKLTRNYVKVVLGGDGGDEIFGGYQHYQDRLFDYEKFKYFPTWSLKTISSIVEKFPVGVRGRNRLSSFRLGAKYCAAFNTNYFDVINRKKLLDHNIVDFLAGNILQPEIENTSFLDSDPDLLNCLMKKDFNHLLPDDYLFKVDRSSMYNSIEVRTPYLDHNLVEFAYNNIPTSFKCSLTQKRILQAFLAKKILPKNFHIERKQGFSIPMDEWMKKIDIDFIIEKLPRELFNYDYIVKLHKGHLQNRKNGSRLFALIMLGISLNNLNLK